MQWDKRSKFFQLISKKCPKSRDDMELKTNYPTADHKYGVQWDKRSRILNSFLKNMACSGTKEVESFNSF